MLPSWVKYGLEDAYISIHESLKHGGLDSGVDVNVEWIHSEELADGYNGELDDVDGLVVPGGFGARGTEGKIEAIRYARENDLPFLGLCLGFQMAVVEYARNVLGLTGAHSAELDEETDHAVIDILPEQKDLEDMGGTMRLGSPCHRNRARNHRQRIYGATSCTERHRHRYEVNPTTSTTSKKKRASCSPGNPVAGWRSSNCPTTRTSSGRSSTPNSARGPARQPAVRRLRRVDARRRRSGRDD